VTVLVVDYGAGNTRSVRSSLTRLGFDSIVSADPVAIQSASHVILPGVGAAGAAMTQLRVTGAAEALVERVAHGGRTLGICLGLQLATSSLEEDDGVPGLGLLDGTTRKLDEHRTPRLGWEMVEPLHEAFYFAHRYAVDTPSASGWANGVVAIAQAGSFLGVQFHPEKSGAAGLAWLEHWCSAD
jgi:imidazole glycerol phosphate synthase glutamine amidotransferase subunit